MPGLVGSTALALLCAFTAVAASPTLVGRDIVSGIPTKADPLEYKFQPVMDFDTDSCYSTAAIDINGKTNPGLGGGKCPTSDCRNRNRLENNNVYSRKRCNNGWCAIM